MRLPGTKLTITLSPKPIVLMALAGTVIVGCSAEAPNFLSPEGKPIPYILKEGCRFKIVGNSGSAAVTSPKIDGMPGATASASISLGERSITVSDCMVVRNSHSLPIYEG